tara:strand:- start:1619 stop:1945 length:327 start_codon:yes stop_codon:yes gene_type:complete
MVSHHLKYVQFHMGLEGVRVGSRRWEVLEEVVKRPGQVTARDIADELGDFFGYVNEARITLTRKGYIALGNKVGRSHYLVPTEKGIREYSTRRKTLSPAPRTHSKSYQ